MNSPFRNLRAMLLPALTLLWLTGCASTPSAEPPPTVPKRKPMPLPAAILRIDSKPSTSTLSKGQQWLQDSERILTGETQK